MKKEFDKVFLNEYGYYELKQKPLQSDRQKEFEEEYYQNSESTYEQQYSAQEQQFFANKLEQKELIIRKNLGKEKFSLLDIGCGEGFVLAYFLKKGMEVAGIDYSDWAVSHHNPGVLPFLQRGDCLQLLPQMLEQGRHFDVINIDSALDMMLEPEKVAALCRRLLADDGIFLVKVANNYSPLQLSLLEEGVLSQEYWLDDPGHPSYFNRDGFLRFMQAQGFCCVDFYGESFIELNLLNPLTNYYENKSVGKDCFQAKLNLENRLHAISPQKSLELFHILGEMGFGRELIGVFQKAAQK